MNDKRDSNFCLFGLPTANGEMYLFDGVRCLHADLRFWVIQRIRKLWQCRRRLLSEIDEGDYDSGSGTPSRVCIVEAIGERGHDDFWSYGKRTQCRCGALVYRRILKCQKKVSHYGVLIAVEIQTYAQQINRTIAVRVRSILRCREQSGNTIGPHRKQSRDGRVSGSGSGRVGSDCRELRYCWKRKRA